MNKNKQQNKKDPYRHESMNISVSKDIYTRLLKSNTPYSILSNKSNKIKQQLSLLAKSKVSSYDQHKF